MKHLNGMAEFNRLWSANDQIYREAASWMGLSDAAFWLMYLLREKNCPISQSTVCTTLYIPKQTIHSAMKKLEENGVLALTPAEHGRSKLVALTQKGEQMARATVDRVIQAEQQAMDSLTEDEREALLSTLGKYTAQMKKNMQVCKSGENE